MNYFASVAFACVLFILLGAHSLYVGDIWTLRLVIAALVFAWVSCYVGAAVEEGDTTGWFWVASICLTGISAVLALVAVLRALA